MNSRLRDHPNQDFIVEDQSNEESKYPSPQMQKSIVVNDFNHNTND